jgi:hypothetical protein
MMGLLDRVGTGAYTIPDRLDPARTDLRDEFMRDPLGYHSEELQLVLGAMRSNRDLPRWVLVTVRQGREWILAEAPGRRGDPLRILGGHTFTDRADAERHIFELRWQALGARADHG